MKDLDLGQIRFKFMWVKMKSKRENKNNKKNNSCFSGRVANKSFNTICKADEQVDVKPTDNTVAEGKHHKFAPPHLSLLKLRVLKFQIRHSCNENTS